MPTSTGKTLCLYAYDPLDRQTRCAPFDQEAIQRFHCEARLATEVQGAVQRSISQSEEQLLAVRQYEGTQLEVALVAVDQQRTVLHVLDATSPRLFAYTPYGHRPLINGRLGLLGFNGERPDPVTGHYHLGNGYRQFNPVLMRFNNPDSWSPFGKGGLNAYAYCEGKPILNRDPDGHSFVRSLILKPLKNIFTSRESSSVIAKNLFTADLVSLDGKPEKTPTIYLGDEYKLREVKLFKHKYIKLNKVSLELDRHRVEVENKNLHLMAGLDFGESGLARYNNGGGVANSSRKFNYLSDNANSAPMRQFLGSMEKLDAVTEVNRELSALTAAQKIASIRGVVP